jgi:hypothetical protein
MTIRKLLLGTVAALLLATPAFADGWVIITNDDVIADDVVITKGKLSNLSEKLARQTVWVKNNRMTEISVPSVSCDFHRGSALTDMSKGPPAYHIEPGGTAQMTIDSFLGGEPDHAVCTVRYDWPFQAGEKAVIFWNLTIVCRDISVMSDGLGVVDINDTSKNIYRTCRRMQQGDRITVEDRPSPRENFACIRPEGEDWGDCYWVQRSQLVRPAEWLKRKAELDALNSMPGARRPGGAR